jgi:hypothetical protein
VCFKDASEVCRAIGRTWVCEPNQRPLAPKLPAPPNFPPQNFPPPNLPPHLQLQLDALEDVHVVHRNQDGAPLKLGRELAAAPLELGPAKALQEAAGVDAWGGGVGGWVGGGLVCWLAMRAPFPG